MIKIIDGRRYDTTTATLVAQHSNNLGCRDFRDYSEELYRTKKGAFFMYGEGGPLTRWARTVGGNMQTNGSNIVALTADEAREWCEQWDKIDALDEYFVGHIVDA